MKRSRFLEISSQLDLPFLETNQELIQKIFEILKLKFRLIKNSNQKLVDLGSGNGQIILFSALNYGIKSIGIEINQDLIKEAKKYMKSFKKEKLYHRNLFKKIKFIHGDFFEMDMRDFDFIYIYSLPTMQKYLQHIFLKAKNKSIIISYKFPLNGFDNFLKLEYELKSEFKDKLISTFYYEKF
ncbi:MAG: methyltransferase domain-containing protein [Candidatus Odinarchaeota archaeon]